MTLHGAEGRDGDNGTGPDLRRGVRRSGEDRVDIATWSGSVPPSPALAPRVRIGRDRWLNLLWLIPIGFVLLIAAVAAAQGLRGNPSVQAFMERNPGVVDPGVGPGIPAWVGWQHFFNLFLMTFIIRSGIQIITDHPRLYWTRHCTPGREWFRIQKPVPDDPLWTAKQDSVSLPGQVGLPGVRHSIGFARWWHLGIDVLWLVNGLVFYILLFATGHWRRLVPTSWDVFPNSVTVLIEYLSLDWPTENGWVAYNSLQQLTYFVTVFVVGPAALLTGLGMSPALSTRFRALSRVLSIQVARSLHFLVLVWFLLFIVIHVALVFTTGLLRNLNHMYAGRDANTWVGFAVFAASMVVVIVGWVAATPVTFRYPRLIQRVGAALLGPAERLFEHVDTKPGEYTEADISPYLWHNGRYPENDTYRALQDSDFADYRLRIGGEVDNPVDLSLTEVRALPHHEQITQHFCIQGWSGVAKWGGVSMTTVMELVKPSPEVRWVVFYSLGEGADGGTYYDAHPIEQMGYHLTMLAYDMNDAPLSYGHGAPIRLRNEVQLGFKHVKWIGAIEFVSDFESIGRGFGGYNEDHEFFGYRQSL
ncbi:molybdopterin-dependent oxidoreductase [Rhodococcus sp. NPDC058505]|uniref:molybdopterin-dependent oxidoreductase n=1 Tax=unclassified Rhodococcus (in: high G+C Gram-positive bacteria) TaxID=192944 RepID=UPI003667BA08